MGLFDLFGRHLLDHLFQADRRIGVAADGAERVPHVGPNQVGRGQSQAQLVIPPDTRLRARMPLHRGAQIPFERALKVLLDPKAKAVHHADQLLGLGVARPGRGQKLFARGGKLARLHQIAGLFQFGPDGRGGNTKGKHKLAHGAAGLLFCGAAWAQELPAPLTDDDFLFFDREQAAIGHQLFYDPILSGNRNISCAHCHHPDFGTSDGLSLGIGEGGRGLGPDRTPGTGADRIRKRIPRNAPGLWNLGARDIHTMFHDGRLSLSDVYGNGFNSPAQEWLPEGLNSLLAAQALFPLTAQFEMAGNVAENEVTGAVHDRIDKGWPIIAKRVRTDPKYGPAMVAAFDDVDSTEDITITHVANALAAFMAIEWRSTDSPFDHFLTGDETALTPDQKAGMRLFYGKARCATCHSGPLLSDQKFHALALPPFGPGRTRQWDAYARDVGRMGESNRLEDAYRYRTPMLRNVALTAPYGHNGAFPDLEGIIRHHLNPATSLSRWTSDQAALPKVPWLEQADFIVWQDQFEMARQRAKVDITPVDLSDGEIAQLVAFLHALTGTSVETPPFGVPADFKP